MSSKVSAATSPTRSPSRTSRVRIAKSRHPVAVLRSQPASNAATCVGSNPFGKPVNVHPAGEGTPAANGRSISPATCANLSSDRTAVTIRLADRGC
jgi:hypothetical protein